MLPKNVVNWENSQTMKEFGNTLYLSWEAQASLLSGDSSRLLGNLARALGETLAMYGYKPDMTSVRLYSIEDQMDGRVVYEARVRAEFQADPVSFCYALYEEVQKLRDLLAMFIEIKED